MPDDYDDSVIHVIRKLRAYASTMPVAREPDEVAASVADTDQETGSRRLFVPVGLLLGALAITASVAIYGRVSESTSAGSDVAVAVVNDLEYVVSGARSLRIESDLLSRVGEATQFADHRLADTTAYSVDGIDAEQILVMRLVPGAEDDVGSLGEYFLLWRGADALLQVCPYFDRSSPATPEECR